MKLSFHPVLGKRCLKFLLAVSLAVYTLLVMGVYNTGKSQWYKLPFHYDLSSVNNTQLTSSLGRKFSAPVNNSRNSSSSRVYYTALHRERFLRNAPDASISEVKFGSRNFEKFNDFHPLGFNGRSHGNDLNPESFTDRYFRNRVQGRDKYLLLKTIEIFDKIMTESSSTYFIYGGTLIGSYRHHGLIPWDDDVDVMVSISQRRLLYHTFSKLFPEYELNTSPIHYWKLYPGSASSIYSYDWKWPFLDIFFFEENSTHIWDVHPTYSQSFVFQKKDVFPLRRRPFMDLLLLAPHNPRAVIQTNYKVNLCQSAAWIHKWEREGTQATMPCSMLHSRFPFVQRRYVHGGCNETLEFNGTVIDYFFDWGVPCV